MALDPSIILAQKPMELPNPLESAAKALTVRSLIQQGESNQLKLNQEKIQAQDQQSMRDAYKANTTVGPDGNPNLNNAGMMKDLTNANPAMAIKFSLDQKQVQLEQLQRQHAIAKDVIFSINDQASQDAAIKKAKDLGLPPLENMLPPQYDPHAVRQVQMRNLSAEEQIAQQNKELEHARGQQEADSKTLEANVKAADAGLSTRLPFGGGAGPAAAPQSAPAKKSTSNTSSAAKPAAMSDGDPADMLGKVPSKDRDKVAAAIDAAKNATRNGPKIMEAFDNAYGQHAIDYVPGTLNEHQKAFHALMGPTFKDIEGTVRQAAMDNMFSNTTPQFGDRGTTPQTKRNAVQDYLLDKQNASLAKYYGIDLSKYKMTNAKAALDSTKKGPARGGEVSADVKNYAEKHGITVEQAAAIKAKRTGG